MVYIYKKKVGVKEYYYLRISSRKGDRILVKDIAYLGSSLEEAKKALNQLPKYAEQIRKAYKTINHFLESNRYTEKVKALKIKQDDFLQDKLIEIESCKLHYNTEFQHQPFLTKQEIFKNFIVEFAFNTASIEGNTIKLNEVRNLLQEGLTPKYSSIRELYDIQNTERIFGQLLELEEELSHELIQKVHSGLMENIDARKGYRVSDVRVIKANFKATPAPYVKTDMNLLLQWYEKNKTQLHPLVLASVLHHKFEKIHPFMDGNGRTGRMLLNYILIRNKFPPLVIHTKTRAKYLGALRTADHSKPSELKKEDYQPLIDFLAEEMTNTYWNIFL